MSNTLKRHLLVGVLALALGWLASYQVHEYQRGYWNGVRAGFDDGFDLGARATRDSLRRRQPEPPRTITISLQKSPASRPDF